MLYKPRKPGKSFVKKTCVLLHINILLFIVQTSDKQTEIDFQMNANELYPIVKPAIIVGICGQTGLVTSFLINY